MMRQIAAQGFGVGECEAETLRLDQAPLVVVGERDPAHRLDRRDDFDAELGGRRSGPALPHHRFLYAGVRFANQSIKIILCNRTHSQ